MRIKQPSIEFWAKDTSNSLPERSSPLSDSQGSVGSVEDEKTATTIMVVEDNEVIQIFCSGMIEQSTDFIPAVFENGKLALDAYQLKPADYCLILMDVDMPRMNGIQATRAIKAYERVNELIAIPIICISGDDKNFKAALEAGMNDVMGKPFKVGEMISLIHNLVNKEGQKEIQDSNSVQLSLSTK